MALGRSSGTMDLMRSFESFFKAKLHFVALVNQQIAMER